MGECEGGEAPSRRPRRRRGHYRGYLCSADVTVLGTCNNWNFNTSNPCVYVGGNYNQNTNHGLFYVNYNSASNTNANIGCRNLLSAMLILHFTAQVVAHLLVKISNFGERVSTLLRKCWKARTAKRRKYPYEKSERPIWTAHIR